MQQAKIKEDEENICISGEYDSLPKNTESKSKELPRGETAAEFSITSLLEKTCISILCIGAW